MRGEFDFSAVGDILREAAETLILPRFRNLNESEIRTKSHPGDLVTPVDLESEAFLSDRLSALLPGSRAMGEEAVYRDPACKACLDDAAPVWIIDPVDGTSNYARGSAEFAVIVALAEGGRTVAGWIYDPLTGRLFAAERGGGAWCNGRRLHTRERGSKALSELNGCLSRRLAEKHRERFAGLRRSGSAAHDYMALSGGGMDFRLFRLLNPWDHAAGVLMVEEAGGFARLLSGAPYTPHFLAADGLLIAPDAATWDDLRRTLEI
jgi:fructose-1,6-bisphosphatase/inositol monophosphatase family enzyme